MIEKILLTRPAGFNDQIAAALQARKVQVVQAPLIQIQGLNLVTAQLSPDGYLDPEQYIIFTSQNAIDYSGDLIPQLVRTAKANVFAVGPATKMRLEALGVLAVASDKPGSEPLLSLPVFAAPFTKKVLIVTGLLGRDYLETTLQDRGATVARYECYERVPQRIENLDELIAEGYNAILVTSTDILQALSSQLTGVSRQHVVLCVTASRIADVARRLGYSQIIEAPDASVSGILEGLTLDPSNQGAEFP